MHRNSQEEAATQLFMEKRAHKRVDAIIAAKFSGDSSYYANCLGTVMNISENGMRLESCKCLPLNSNSTLFIYDNDRVLSIQCKVIRTMKDNSFYNVMGIQVMQTSPDYLEFLDHLKSSP